LAAQEFRSARTVLVYQSDATEVDTREILLACLDQGKRAGLPRVDAEAKRLQALEVAEVARDLERSRYGFKEPLPDRPAIPLAELDLIVVPGRAFDSAGRRLGRGGGYYDRLLAQPGLRAVTAALAFDCQVVEHVPAAAHDRTVDLIVTESRTLRTAAPKAG
jgi:5-formyltetrahydrofolate cyclo-ligase